MARLGCRCGAEMTNTEGPSPHRLNVFLKSEIDKALSYNQDISPDFRVFRQILVRTFKITKEFAIVIHF